MNNRPRHLSRLSFVPVLIGSALIAAAPPAATAQGQSAHSAPLAFTTFQDPFEQAFTADVPRGWSARGGLFRMGYSDERVMIDLTSPDGKINVRLGDLAVPTYVEPDRLHPEGGTYDLGLQAQLPIAHYRSGPEFAALYSRVRFYKDCQNPAADTADIDFTLPAYIPPDGPPPAKTSAGQIATRCTTSQGPRIAFVFARTGGTAAVWAAGTLGSYLAPPDQIALARTVLDHCAHTFKMSPQWIDRQKQLDADALEYQRRRQAQRRQQLGQQIQQFEAGMQAMRNQVSAFERHQQAQAAQVEGFTQALRGVTPTVDPLTGEAREVWTGSQDGYWANGVGAVANSASSPGPGWHQLQITRPQ